MGFHSSKIQIDSLVWFIKIQFSLIGATAFFPELINIFSSLPLVSLHWLAGLHLSWPIFQQTEQQQQVGLAGPGPCLGLAVLRTTLTDILNTCQTDRLTPPPTYNNYRASHLTIRPRQCRKLLPGFLHHRPGQPEPSKLT